MNTSRKFLKVDKNIQRVMLIFQLILGIIGFTQSTGFFIMWVPVITLFLGIYQWGISGMIHQINNQYTAEPIKKWRRFHMVGSAIYVLLAVLVTMVLKTNDVFIVLLMVIPQLIAYAYYFLTVWDERLYNKYQDNLGY
ncbi:MAG TPA: hypothetical protein DCS93_17890 [Microscillaceae bacterium]|nr:hypothetical protein [Microscillaceae bacterium]